MAPVVYREIEVDRCTDCGGLWFDPVELERLKAARGSEAIDAGDPKRGRELNSMKRVLCPTCGTSMLRMVNPRQTHIWYERCPSCYGVFLDAGEFKDYKHETLLDLVRDLWARRRT